MTGELVLKKIAQQILFPFRNISLTVLDVSLVFSDFFFFFGLNSTVSSERCLPLLCVFILCICEGG